MVDIHFSQDAFRGAGRLPDPLPQARGGAGGRPRRRGLNSPGYTVSLIVADYVVGWVSFALALLILASFSRNAVNHISNFGFNLQHGFWYPISIVIGFAVTGGYRLNRRSPTQSTFSDFKDYAMSCCVGAFIALTLSYAAHHFGKWAIQVPTQIIVAIIVTSFMTAASHATLRHIVLRRRPQRVAVVDDGSNFKRITTHLHLEHGLVLIGRIDSSATVTSDSLGSIKDIDEIVATHHIDRIIFGNVTIPPELEYAYRRATEVADTALVPRMHEVISWRSRLTELSGLPLLELAPRNISGYDQFIKRLFDITVSLMALIVTLPLTIVIAAAVKVTSRGPVFYRQDRLGLNRKSFTIMKFRTMREEVIKPDDVAAIVETKRAHGEPLFVTRDKNANVSRLTPIGAFLRRTGLDEIPQFLNVLVGSMSIVGPRPFITAESLQHSPWSERRFEVRPGITGLWQVSGRNNLTEDELRQLDYLYVSAWSMWWDVKICFDTPRAMVRGLGAY